MGTAPLARMQGLPVRSVLASLVLLFLLQSARGSPSCLAENWQCKAQLKACDADTACKAMKSCIWACKDKDGDCWTACHNKHVTCNTCSPTEPMEKVMGCVMINMDIEANYTCHPHSNIPSEYQAASIVRQLVQSQIYANVGTVMKEGGSGGGGAAEAGFPYSTIEHVAADCSSPGDMLLFLSPLHVNTANFHANNKVSIALRDWNDDRTKDPLMAHRMVLLGNLTALPSYGEPGYKQYADCFFAKHPDAREWEHIPSHNFTFHKFTHMATHYTGGFGDTHFIGWIDDDTYRAVPSSSDCSAWSGCGDMKGKCCPFDGDNNFKECCGHFK